MVFGRTHRGSTFALLFQTASASDWRDSNPTLSINFWNRIVMSDSHFALDAGQTRAEDSAWRMSPKVTLPDCILFSKRIDPVRNIARHYVLSIEPTLFASTR
jgi:hypothetical protein